MERDTVQDLVCGMRLRKDDAAATCEWNGSTYHFCCEGCRDAFLEDPERYVHRGEEVEK